MSQQERSPQLPIPQEGRFMRFVKRTLDIDYVGKEVPQFRGGSKEWTIVRLIGVGASEIQHNKTGQISVRDIEEYPSPIGKLF